jgi:DNA-binding transcriptional LysR family regulator
VVGASSDPPSNRIGDIVAALRARHPMVTVDLHAGSSARTRQALKTGELDVGMFLGRPADVDFAYYRLAAVPYRIAGPVAWKARIETDDWAQLCTLPWLAPNDSSLASSTMLSQLFAERGLELNTVARFDNGALGHALLRAGVGVMLMREEHALEGEREGRLAVSPIGHAAFDLLVAHMAGRDHDPLIGAFLEAVKTAWPQMHLVTPTRS